MENSHAPDRTRRRHEEVVPHDPASLGIQAIGVQSLQSGPRRRFRNMTYRIFFPRLHHETRGHFPIRAAQGILWLGRHALHVHGVIDRALQGAGPSADISTLFGQRRSDDTT